MRSKGKITIWDDDKGFGFISPVGGGKEVFFHVSAFANRKKRPNLNQLVQYTLSKDKSGRLRATDVTLPGATSAQKARHKKLPLSTIGAAFFLLMVGGSVFLGKVPFFMLVIYLLATLLTYLIYAVDKAAAQQGFWRTKENTLHLLALVGGWPGALVAQQKFRHKTTKQPFRTIFWLTVVLNCGFLGWLFTPGGETALEAFIAILPEIPADTLWAKLTRF